MFIDKVEISIKAGNGGNGHISFFRDKLTQKGGPDGGDGGRGGNVIFVGSSRIDNLIDFRFAKNFRASDGENGGKRNRSGANGADLRIAVPLGTRILKVPDGELLCDITEDAYEYRALSGGAGGRGNARFATSRRQTPNFSQNGVKTETYRVTLELNTIADVGLIGFPNVGKSTILSVVTRANPKIANYHFTTLHPNIGVYINHGDAITIADIPGLIKGASHGAGLGTNFLKHINRTRLLVHVVDISEQDGRDAVQDFETINTELRAFDPELASRPQIIALNKTDSADSQKIEAFRKTYGKNYKIFEISAITRAGLDELMNAVIQELVKLPKPIAIEPAARLENPIDKNSFTIEILDGLYHVVGPLIDNLIRGVVLNDTESNAYFQRRLLESGVIAELRKNGMQEGDTVRISDIEFEWVD